MDRPRIALYAHDTMGHGHTRRNLAIAEALLASRLRPEVLLLGGARETGQPTAALGTFRPQLLIVDQVARGAPRANSGRS